MESEENHSKKVEDQGQGLFLYEEQDEVPEEEKRPIPRTKIIPFSLGDEWYGIDIKNLLEVLDVPSITRVPNLPDYIRGVINVRGDIVSITDPKKLFGLEAEETLIRSENKIIVVYAAKKTTGILVDSVAKVLNLPMASIQPTLSTIPDIKAEYIKGEVILADKKLLTLLDFERIMLSQEMRFE